MRINEVARKTGLSSKAIRFYEEKALITPPLRGENGYRYYSPQQIRELTLLRHARQAGFSLQECRDLIKLLNDPHRHSAEVKQRTERRIAAIEAQIRDLAAVRDSLQKLVQCCPGDEQADCPIIAHLIGDVPETKAQR